LGLAEIILFDDARFRHFVIEVIPLAGSLTDTCKYGNTTVKLGDVIDELHDYDRLAHTRATEGTHFAPFEEGADQINDFDAGRQHLGGSGLISQRGSRPMNGIILLNLHRSALIDGISRNVEHPAHHAITYRH